MTEPTSLTSTFTPAMNRQPSRRAATLPTRINTSNEQADMDAKGAETLFAHQAAKVVSFSASKLGGPGASKTSKPEAGTLPWTSRGELLISLGALRIYRLRGSVSFLHAGSLLLSLLPRSQCWCVDGESKFAMRIQHLIYRIELPNTTESERLQVENLKEVLGKILLYEKTPCPFRRGFIVELPEEAEMEAVLGRRGMGMGEGRGVGMGMGMGMGRERAKRWEMKDIWRREGEVGRSMGRDMGSPEESEDEGSVRRENELPSAGGEQEVDRESERIEHDPAMGDETKPPIRPRAETNRSFTAPAQLATVAEAEAAEDEADVEGLSEPEITMGPETRPRAGIEMKAEEQAEAQEEAEPEAGTKEEPEREQEHDTTYQNVGELESKASIKQDSDSEHDHDIADRSRASSIRSYYTSIGLQSTFPPSPASEYADPFESLPLYPYTITTEGQPTDLVQFTTTRTVPAAGGGAGGSDVTTPLSATYPPSLISDSTDSTSTSSHIPTSSVNTITSSSNTTTQPLTRPRTRTRTSTLSSAHSASHTSSTTRAPTAIFPAHYRQTQTQNSSQNKRTPSLMSRTCALLLGPPSGLVSAMVQIASRITSGTLREPDHSANAVAYRYNQNLDGLPGRWEDSEEERDGRGTVEPVGGGESFATMSLRRGLAEHEDDEFDDLEEDEEDDYYDGIDDDDDHGYRLSAGGTPARLYKHMNEEEDDFGVPLGNDTPARKGRRNWGWVRSPKGTPKKEQTQSQQDTKELQATKELQDTKELQQEQDQKEVVQERGLRVEDEEVEEEAQPKVD